MSIAFRFDDEIPHTLEACTMTAPRATPTEHHAIVERLSHELRTPLNSVIGFSRVLTENRTGNQRPADLAMLAAIRTNGERLLGLVEDLVALSVVPAASDRPVPPDANVVAIAEEVIGNWRDVAEAKRLKISLRVESYDMVRLEPIRLAKLLDKLIGNAVKFTARGGVVITVDGSTSRRFEGAGLGLPIARALAVSMGCALDVESTPGCGTRFELSFPI